MKKKIIVTGGLGFIGSNLIEYQLSKYLKVINLVKFSFCIFPAFLKYMEKNIMNPRRIRKPDPKNAPASFSPCNDLLRKISATPIVKHTITNKYLTNELPVERNVSLFPIAELRRFFGVTLVNLFIEILVTK